MEAITYSHNYGEHAVIKSERELILDIISKQNSVKSNNITSIKDNILTLLKLNGWSIEPKISQHSNMTIKGMKRKMALCLQTGNNSNTYSDMLKSEHLYRKNMAKAVFFILPTKKSSSIIGSNVANFDRFVNELNIYKHIITVPIFVIGIE